jgi:homoserine O-succinyltransferase
VILLRTSSYTGRNTPITHLQAFYETWSNIKDQRLDALVVTGAPVEQMAFEEVLYWEELQALMTWAESHVHSCFYICWGAQAALYHHYGVPKHPLEAKIFGVYGQRVTSRNTPLTAGFDDEFLMPVSRYTEARLEDVTHIPELDVLAISDRSGLCMLEDRARRRVFVFNHLEYDADTLKREYFRDLEAGLSIHLPENYFPGDDPDQSPMVTWRAHRSLLFGNWINDVYQSTPFDLSKIGSGAAKPASRPDRRAAQPSKVEA